jgi:5-methylcytosine-specific restriction endonuclease McrA
MICRFCNREILNKGSHAAHEMSCKNNPNKIKHIRSPNAGRKKGCVAWNKNKKINNDKHWNEKYPLDTVMTTNSTYSRHSLKSRIIKNNIINYNCSICGIGPIWMGKPMTLILDHINGINNDNRIENLRFVCSNCDSQLSTYKSRNRGVNRTGEPAPP